MKFDKKENFQKHQYTSSQILVTELAATEPSLMA